ncbi:MAG: AraC family transcriptional regulator ligand-binding domain-containing protein [Burkholderiaceae bacterium]|nr:AraC family transcriptional regulator ligand-binding domain-containing protein [Burkholderiaceae bacterium]
MDSACAAVLGCWLVRHATTPHSRHICDAVLAIAYRILRALCGDDFVPVGLQFPSHRPESVDACQRLFRAPLNFDAEGAADAVASHFSISARTLRRRPAVDGRSFRR